jgi:hypothetical protein
MTLASILICRVARDRLACERIVEHEPGQRKGLVSDIMRALTCPSALLSEGSFLSFVHNDAILGRYLGIRHGLRCPEDWFAVMPRFLYMLHWSYLYGACAQEEDE